MLLEENPVFFFKCSEVGEWNFFTFNYPGLDVKMHQSMLLMCYGQNNGTLERNVFFIWLHPAIKQNSQYINCEILTTSKDTAGVVVEL